MARPITITDEQILEAARVVFVRHGVNATTKQIAREAGVAEGSIFRRYPTKEALFSAAVLNPGIPSWVKELDEMAGRGDMRANLARVARGLVRFAQEMLPLVRLAWANGDGQTAGTPSREPPGIRDRRLLAAFLQAEMDCGRLRAGSAEAVARMLFGACLSFVMDRLTLERPIAAEEADAFAEALADTVWSGVAPRAR